MSNQYENETPKYLKQKESNISKSKNKSKHKHKYEECLIQYNMKIGLENKPAELVTSLESYCTICGKIGDRFKEGKYIVTDYRKTVDTPIGKCYSYMSDEELYESYHNILPVFFIEDRCTDGYVNLEWRDKKMKNEEEKLCQHIGISIERKHQIDETIKETHIRYINGEIKTRSLADFKKKQEVRRKELE